MNFYAKINGTPVMASINFTDEEVPDDPRNVEGLGIYASGVNEDRLFNRPVQESGFQFKEGKEIVTLSVAELNKRFPNAAHKPTGFWVVVKDNPDYWAVDKWAVESNLKAGVELISEEEFFNAAKAAVKVTEEALAAIS